MRKAMRTAWAPGGCAAARWTVVRYLVPLLVFTAALALPAVASAAPWQLKNPVGPQKALRADLKAVCALDGGTVWAAGAGDALYYTHDGGGSWAALSTGAPQWTEWRAVRFADLRHGLVVGAAAGRTLVCRTTDGGRSWAAAALPWGAEAADVELYGPRLAWIVGARGLVLRSSDGGATWQQGRAGAVDLAAVDFTSASAGVAVGSGGAVYRTVDGGRSWAVAASGGADLLDVTMRTAQTGWAVGRLGAVLRTTDGGRTWQRQCLLPLAGDCVAVDFASATHGWLVSSLAGLLVTHDGGRSWRPEPHGMGAVKLRDIDVPTHFADAAAADAAASSAADPDADAPERAFTAGDGGAIGKYTEVGTESHDNWVYLRPGSSTGAPVPSPLTYTFTLSAYSLTTDQPYDGWKAQGAAATPNDYATYGIDFMAGRSGSTTPADWFTDYCGGIEIGAEASSSTPKDLNFAFNGTLTATGTYEIAFGQGNNTSGNNWWIGSPTFTAQGTTGAPILVTSDGVWQFQSISGLTNVFDMTSQ